MPSSNVFAFYLKGWMKTELRNAPRCMMCEIQDLIPFSIYVLMELKWSNMCNRVEQVKIDSLCYIIFFNDVDLG